MKSEMERHKLLLKQVKKHLPDAMLELPEVKAFIQAVNDSYQAFDRDKEITDHAFRVSEQEYQSLYQNLLGENRLKKLSFEKLKDALVNLKEVDPNIDLSKFDLLMMADYLKVQIEKSREAEQKLSYNLELLTTLVTNFHSGVLIKDEQKKVLFCNAGFCEIFSIKENPESLRGADFSQFTQQHKHLFRDPEDFVSTSLRLINEKQEVRQDTVQMKDGRVFQRHFVPIYINSVYRGHLWEYRDITPQKEAQRALVNSERQYRNIVEKSSDIIYKTDVSGRFTFVNPVAEKITGYSRQQLLGMRYTDLVKPEQVQNTIEFYRKQLEQKVISTYYEFPITTKTGEEKWIGQSVQLSKLSNRDVEFTALAIDITDRMQYQKTIHLLKEKYENIITNMNLGLIEVDAEEKIQYANPGFAAISGYSVEELLGRKAAELFRITNKALIEEKIRKRQRGESDMYEVQVQNKSNEIRWWMISGAPNYDEKGRLTGSIGIHLDITDQKKLESELAIQKEKAEASAKAQATFLANMSHEIRTPLNGIIGMIRELSYEPLPNNQRKYVYNASVASQHLLSVLNNVLDISKIEAGELSIDEHHFILRDVIKDVKSIMSVRAREKGILLGIDTHDLENSVYIGDAARLRQILINLVGNSIKFTAKGGVYMDCLIEALEPTNHKITFVVEDTGIGMDENYQAQLFRKFSQEDSSISRKYGGTGLGMAITYELIQLMRGTITVESRKGEGTRITITLHLRPGDLREVDPDDLMPLTEVDARILLVEDNEFNRSVARNTLERFGCHVDEAENGEIALQLLRRQNYSIILMDLQMPVMDGFETTRVIREEMKLKTPIIALTANAFKSELEHCLLIGMNDSVTKPYDEEKLMSVIYRLLSMEPVYEVKLANHPQEIRSEKSEANQKLYNLAMLHKQGTANPGYVEKMVGIFMSQTQQVLPELKAAYQRKDLDTVYKLAHKIKPSLDGMGIESLRDRVRSVETAAQKLIDSPELGRDLTLLCETLERVLEQLSSEKFS